MARLIITRGLPGSGKSTFARDEVNAGNGVAMCRDDMRRTLYGSEADHKRLSHDQEAAVTTAHRSAVSALLRGGNDVIEHSMNLRAAYVRDWQTVAAECGAEFMVWDLTSIPVEVCVELDAQREISVGAEVINDLYRRFVKGKPYPLPVPEPRVSTRVPADNRWRLSRPDAVIVDIDGTVAHNDGHRGWYEYDKVADDKPHDDVIHLVQILARRHRIVFVSGRSEDCREDTKAWIDKHVFGGYFDSVSQHELWMRKSGDHRNDSVVKYELFDKHIRDRFNIACVLDDRDRVVKMWREDLGLRCLQVAPGNF